MRPRIDAVQPVLGSRDLSRSIRFYQQLGFVLSFGGPPDVPRYAAVTRDGVELHLQWQGLKEWERIGDRPTYRFVVADVDGIYLEFREAGVAEQMTAIMETSWGTREFHVRDPDGNGLQFYRAL